MVVGKVEWGSLEDWVLRLRVVRFGEFKLVVVVLRFCFRDVFVVTCKVFKEVLD